jgi:phenylalanyl-tRNA synthetase beta chain
LLKKAIFWWLIHWLDKPFLRKNLRSLLKEKLQFNLLHILFDTEPVKIFEIGHVYETENGGVKEKVNLVIGIARRGVKQKIQEGTRGEMAELKELLAGELKIDSSLILKTVEGEEESEADNVNNLSWTVLELDFDRIAEAAGNFLPADLASLASKTKTYRKVSSYPRIIRDVAVWVPENVADDEVQDAIKSSAGELLVLGPVLFDKFPKDGRVSLAFRQVFQSYEKTLSDEEVNKIMDEVIAALEKKGWEVRK